jgi:hypothetical protein
VAAQTTRPTPSADAVAAHFFPAACSGVADGRAVIGAAVVGGELGAGNAPTSRLKVKASITSCQWRTMAHNGALGTHLVIGPAQLVLGGFVVLLDPVA